MEPMDFLASLSGIARYRADTSADRPVRLAVIDPAYVASSYPGTLPRVTFEGETTMSTRRYACLYAPSPSDRVVMIPTGTTYTIIGKIGGAGGGGSGGAGSWTALTFNNGTSAKSGYGTPQSRMDTSDLVRLSGVLAIPAALAGGSAIATIADTSHRPSVPRVVPVRSGAGGNVATELTINTDGTLVPLASLGTSATQVGLDHITFVK